MDHLLVAISFLFQRCFIPRNHRLPRTEWFTASDSAIIPIIETRDAKNAFKVVFPARIFDGRELPKITLNLLQYNGNIYWPLCVWETDRAPITGHFTVDQLALLLERGVDTFAFYPEAEQFYPNSGRFEFARHVCRDDEDKNAVKAKKLAWDYLLVCDGRAYIRGGQPVYIKGQLSRHKPNILTVTCSGAHRSMEPFIRVSFNFMAHEWRESIASGNLWQPGVAMTPDGSDLQASVPHIEVLAPNVVVDRRLEMTLDAIYWSTIEFFERPPRSLKKIAPECLEILEVGRIDTTDVDTNKRRYDALADLFKMLPCVHPTLRKSFDRLNAIFGLDLPLFKGPAFGPSPQLSADEEYALDSLQ